MAIEVSTVEGVNVARDEHPNERIDLVKPDGSRRVYFPKQKPIDVPKLPEPRYMPSR